MCSGWCGWELACHGPVRVWPGASVGSGARAAHFSSCLPTLTYWPAFLCSPPVREGVHGRWQPEEPDSPPGLYAMTHILCVCVCVCVREGVHGRWQSEEPGGQADAGRLQPHLLLRGGSQVAGFGSWGSQVAGFRSWGSQVAGFRSWGSQVAGFRSWGSQVAGAWGRGLAVRY